jgi:hypothetical protein
MNFEGLFEVSRTRPEDMEFFDTRPIGEDLIGLVSKAGIRV